jgi:hypothetical protein
MYNPQLTMPLPSHPRPDGPEPSLPRIAVRPDILRPLAQPRVVPTSLNIPFPLRTARLADSFTLTQHIFPAAYPRTYPHVPPPQLPRVFGGDAGAKSRSWKVLVSEIAQTRVDYEAGKFDHLGGSTRPLWCCINRIVRNRNVAHEKPGLSTEILEKRDQSSSSTLDSHQLYFLPTQTASQKR